MEEPSTTQSTPVLGENLEASDTAGTPTSTHGSTVPEAIFNFTNSIVGAGCIGLGGAIALSGGFISIALVTFFAVLTKLSLDLLIRLSIENSNSTTASYEDLAQSGMGYWKGRVLVMVCKLSYSFGCLVAYVIVIKDNCGPALKSLMYGEGDDATTLTKEHEPWFHAFLSNNDFVTWTISLAFILPLCLLRDMTPLAFGSLISVASMITIVGIVIYIYFACPDVREKPTGTFYENWIEIRPGVLSNLGTFIFTFVSQHTVHLVFSSLKPEHRSIEKWKIVSSFSLLAAATVSLLVGVFVYITFWQDTQSDIFQIYPHGWMIDTAKLLLCVTMVFTFPLPFFTCRELLILTIVHPLCGVGGDNTRDASESNNTDDNPVVDDESPVPTNGSDENANENDAENDLRQPLLSQDDQADYDSSTPQYKYNWLLPHDDRQLRLPGHVFTTALVWLVVTELAIASPNLGDILDLVGCASGTLIAFVIPGLLSLSMEGYSHLAATILAVGGTVGTVGTYFSIQQLVRDL